VEATADDSGRHLLALVSATSRRTHRVRSPTVVAAAGPEQSRGRSVRSFLSTALGEKLKNSEELHPPPQKKSIRVCRRTVAALVVTASTLSSPTRYSRLPSSCKLIAGVLAQEARGQLVDQVHAGHTSSRFVTHSSHIIYIAPESRWLTRAH
jgi:hypothetical protein